VAVPAMIAYRFFRSKIDNLVIEMEQQAIKLVEVIHGKRK
jgi:biopolymer transport protein ExbB